MMAGLIELIEIAFGLGAMFAAGLGQWLLVCAMAWVGYRLGALVWWAVRWGLTR